MTATMTRRADGREPAVLLGMRGTDRAHVVHAHEYGRSADVEHGGSGRGGAPSCARPCSARSMAANALHHRRVELAWRRRRAGRRRRTPLCADDVEAAADREGAGDARDRAASPALGIAAAVPALVAVDQRVDGVAAHFAGRSASVVAAPEDALDLVLQVAARLVHGQGREEAGSLCLAELDEGGEAAPHGDEVALELGGRGTARPRG